MLAILKNGAVVIKPETEAEREEFAAWQASATGHVFHFAGGSAKGGALLDLGLRAQACREPINILFTDRDTRWQPISNLALTPFTLDGKPYASVEGFWQGLKFAADADRRRVAALWGGEAKAAAHGQPAPEFIDYEEQTHAVGGPGHRALMLRACRAKFTQNQAARDALLATGDRPLTHRARRDSETIPGALMADIWMRIRNRLVERTMRP